MRMDVRMLTNKVHKIDQGCDIDEMIVLHAYDHMKEVHDQIQSQQLEIGILEQRVENLEQMEIVYEIRTVTLEVMIDYLYYHMDQLVALVVIHLGILL